MVNPCEGCFEKQRKIDRLLEEVERLKAKLRYQERKNQEGFFGSSPPSSQLPFKANADQENRNHKGGARPGHKGHGRKAHSQETVDEIIPIDPVEVCPDCGGVLKLKKIKDRTVIESEPLKPKKILYHLSHKECTQCHHVFQAKAPGVLPKALYGNQITAQMTVMHYFHGIPHGANLRNQWDQLGQFGRDVPSPLRLLCTRDGGPQGTISALPCQACG